MSIFLAIETSSPEYHVALARDGQPIYNSARCPTCRGSYGSRDIAGLLRAGLSDIKANVRDISGIAVNVGPGGLSYIRSGVSFANALSYSLSIRIHSFNTFEILGRQACKRTRLPLVCAIPAANDNAYVARIDARTVQMMRFGSLGPTLKQVLNDVQEVAIAGPIRERLSSLLPGVRVFDTGINSPDMEALIDLATAAGDDTHIPGHQVTPLTEQSAVFYEQT